VCVVCIMYCVCCVCCVCCVLCVLCSVVWCVPIPTAEITIITVDGSCAQITGYYTILQQGGVLLEFGFSPITFTVNQGETYLIGVSEFPPYTLDFWEDDGSTELHRIVSVTTDTTFTAHYLP